MILVTIDYTKHLKIAFLKLLLPIDLLEYKNIQNNSDIINIWQNCSKIATKLSYNIDCKQNTHSISESRLISKELAETLKNYPLYSQDGKEKDATCVCVLHRWHPLEIGRASCRERVYVLV